MKHLLVSIILGLIVALWGVTLLVGLIGLVVIGIPLIAISAPFIAAYDASRHSLI